MKEDRDNGKNRMQRIGRREFRNMKDRRNNYNIDILHWMWSLMVSSKPKRGSLTLFCRNTGKKREIKVSVRP